MKRYHEEQRLIEKRVKQYRRINAWLQSAGPDTNQKEIEPGRYRKTLRCAGCGRSRCQICHSDKFPKRTPTRQEQQAKLDDRMRQFVTDTNSEARKC